MSNLVNVLSMWNLWKNKPNTPLYGSRYSYFQFFIIKIFFLKQEMVETILVSMFHVILSAYWDRTPIFSHIIEPCRKKQIFFKYLQWQLGPKHQGLEVGTQCLSGKLLLLSMGIHTAGKLDTVCKLQELGWRFQQSRHHKCLKSKKQDFNNFPTIKYNNEIIWSIF